MVESREEFLAYPQTSPEIYAWLPYHKDVPCDPEPTAPPAAGTPAAEPAAERPPGPSERFPF